VLRSPVLAPLDLAAEAGRLAGRAAVPGDVVSLQAIESPLAPLNPPPPDRPGLASLGRMDQAQAPAVPSPSGALRRLRRPRHGGIGGVGRSVNVHGHSPCWEERPDSRLHPAKPDDTELLFRSRDGQGGFAMAVWGVDRPRRSGTPPGRRCERGLVHPARNRLGSGSSRRPGRDRCTPRSDHRGG
jgi:hypothetical protein